MRAALALLLVLAAVPASAQSATDPIDTVRAFYAEDDIGAVGFYAKRLRALYVRGRREAGGEVGRLDFAFHVNGQETGDDWTKTLKLIPLVSDEARAEVQATFHNGTPQDLRYDVVCQNGHWPIADVRSVKARTWDLATILSARLPWARHETTLRGGIRRLAHTLRLDGRGIGGYARAHARSAP